MVRARVIKEIKRQVGTSNKVEDKKRRAMCPGKRESKKGKEYYVYDKNRTDRGGKDTPKGEKCRKYKKIRKSKRVWIKKHHITKIINGREKRVLISGYYRYKKEKVYK